MIFTTFLRRKFSLLVAVLVIVSLSSPAYSSELTKNKKQLQNVSSQLKKTRQKINQAKKLERNLADQINVIDSRIENVQHEYNKLDDQLEQVSSQRSSAEGQLEGLQKDLFSTRQQLEEAEIKLSKQKIALNQRLEGIYKRGETGYIEFILSSDNFTDLLNRMRFMEIIMNQDVNIIDQVESTKNEIEDTKLELEQERKSVNDKRTHLVMTEQTIKDLTKKKMAQKEILSEEINNKQNVLQQIQEDRAAYELAEDQLLQQSKSLTGRIRDLEKKLRKKNPSKAKNYGASGGFEWPTDGQVTSSFGMRMHPILKKMKMHTGVDIGAPYGQSVHAACDGVVLQAGTISGYGQTVIISHGNGISTLYAHLSVIKVSEGEEVSKGDTIANIGSTGLSTGPHLHFEVRKDGEPQNPMNWY